MLSTLRYHGCLHCSKCIITIAIKPATLKLQVEISQQTYNICHRLATPLQAAWHVQVLQSCCRPVASSLIPIHLQFAAYLQVAHNVLHECHCYDVIHVWRYKTIGANGNQETMPLKYATSEYQFTNRDNAQTSIQHMSRSCFTNRRFQDKK